MPFSAATLILAIVVLAVPTPLACCGPETRSDPRPPGDPSTGYLAPVDLSAEVRSIHLTGTATDLRGEPFEVAVPAGGGQRYR